MKKLTSLLLAAALVFTALPAAFALSDYEPKLVTSGSIEFDDDGSDGYSGDYVVIYNPSTSAGSSVSTGNMSGLIETTVGTNASVQAPDAIETDRPYKLDIDSALFEESMSSGIPKKPVENREPQKALSFNIGDTHSFKINSQYSPLSSEYVEFKLLAKGEHCYIWTPTSTAANVHPLDGIDESFAEICADEFDSKFPLMQDSFGNHSNGSQGDGRLNMLYYNIDDGWQPGEGYVAGFFSAADLYYNSMPVLNIDTYPGIYYERTNGDVIIDVTGTYSTMVHEYQHLIHYSVAGSSDTWINECMSAAAEEICYPGSSVAPRIQSWLNYYFSQNQDWLNPPTEHEYTSSYELHKGYSMYDWSNYLPMNDTLVLYAQVSLFAQYIYTQYGNPTFRAILEQLAQGKNFVAAFQAVTGQSATEFVNNFRIALTANAPAIIEGGLYSFRMQPGYDPASYYNVENLYSWLAPVVFTGSSCDIKGGGAITVKPVGGTYYPPAGANASLKYMGVTVKDGSVSPAPVTDVSLTPNSASLYIGGSATLQLIREPANANGFEVTWTSSNPAVASVSGNLRNATVNALAKGSATITASVHDTINNQNYTASAAITVRDVPGFNEAANVENGTLSFDNNIGSYHWVVDATTDPDRISVRSDNRGVNSSDAAFSLTVDLNAGDTVSFDWRVSSERNYDKLRFYVDGSEKEVIYGETNWEEVTFTATQTRSYTFKWEYHKDVSTHSGSDCGWVDNIFVPGHVASNDYIKGDVNMSGSVEVIDALYALRNAMQLMSFTALETEIADMDNNGSITVIDALTILRMAMGLIS